MKAPSSSLARPMTWLIVSALPFIPLYGKLLLNLFSDTPEAYLCIVPVLAYVWAFRQLVYEVTDYQDDMELNIILGTSLSVLVLLIVLWGPRQFPLTFYGRSDILLLWPLWGLAMGWLWFGVGVTRWLWKPMAYLILAVPVLYTSLAGWVIGGLQSFTGDASRWLLQSQSWVQWNGSVGEVTHGTQHIAFSLVTACTGADSILAVLLILVYLWPLYRGFWGLKLVWVLTGMAYAFCGNVLRISFLIWILHESGVSQLFDLVHAGLGLVIFALLSYALVLTGRLFGLVRWEAKQPVKILAVTGKSRTFISMVSTMAFTVMVFVAWSGNQTNMWRDVVTTTDISIGQYPLIRGYYATGLASYNDSSVLGEGTRSYAVAYSTQSGQYYRVEAWTTPAGWRLQQYSVNNCLSFHGDTILSRELLRSVVHVHGSLYSVVVPPLSRGMEPDIYAVAAYTFRVQGASGQPVYERIEISTPLRQATNSQPGTLSTASLVQFANSLLGSVIE
ncbi:hypothetical protein AN477_17665 [Alicyclobacillus ferrooxydans]|uniref:Uncharacterized protein n=2 Tax=Alicyclobacillus ferrooxydans TaxID=471514 RepID=A0A0P9CAJ8_9BACL|nr:hypothetical protein AN477_17665 [Alicyclobacillus ferrooxydans]